MIRSALLAGLPGIRHAHTTREDGPVGGRGVAGTDAVRERLAAELSCRADAFVVPAQVHGLLRAIVVDERVVAALIEISHQRIAADVHRADVAAADQEAVAGIEFSPDVVVGGILPVCLPGFRCRIGCR